MASSNAIFFDGQSTPTLVLNNSDATGNSADVGGGIVNTSFADTVPAGTVTLHHTDVSGTNPNNYVPVDSIAGCPAHPVPSGHAIRPRRSWCPEFGRFTWRQSGSGAPTAPASAPTTTRRRSTTSAIARLPAFHSEPETNGVAEKALQTLEEQLLWIERFDTLDQFRTAVRAFGRTYNQQWLIERHGYRTPIEAREHLRAKAAAGRGGSVVESSGAV